MFHLVVQGHFAPVVYRAPYESSELFSRFNLGQEVVELRNNGFRSSFTLCPFEWFETPYTSDLSPSVASTPSKRHLNFDTIVADRFADDHVGDRCDIPDLYPSTAVTALENVDYVVYLDNQSLSLQPAYYAFGPRRPDEGHWNEKTFSVTVGPDVRSVFQLGGGVSLRSIVPFFSHIGEDTADVEPIVLPPQRSHLIFIIGVPEHIPPEVLLRVLRIATSPAADAANPAASDAAPLMYSVNAVRILKRTPRVCQAAITQALPAVAQALGFYACLLIFASQKEADLFYKEFRGALYATLYAGAFRAGNLGSNPQATSDHSTESVLGGACYLVHLSSVTYVTKQAEERQGLVNVAVPKGLTLEACSALPSCPVCLERIDSSVFGIHTRFAAWGFMSPDNGVVSLSCPICLKLYVMQRLGRRSVEQSRFVRRRKQNLGRSRSHPPYAGLHDMEPHNPVYLRSCSADFREEMTQRDLHSTLRYFDCAGPVQNYAFWTPKREKGSSDLSPCSPGFSHSCGDSWSTRASQQVLSFFTCEALLQEGMYHTLCVACSNTAEIWICLVCGHLGCGRYKSQHAQKHAAEFGHRLCLQLSTGRIWDYGSESFVHRQLVFTRQNTAEPPTSLDGMSSRQMIRLPQRITPVRYAGFPYGEKGCSRGHPETSRVTYAAEKPGQITTHKKELDASDTSNIEDQNNSEQQTSSVNPAHPRGSSIEQFHEELEVLLASQSELQAALYSQRLHDHQSYMWNIAQEMLREREHAEATITELKSSIESLQAEHMKRRARNQKLQREADKLIEDNSLQEELNRSLIATLRTLESRKAAMLEAEGVSNAELDALQKRVEQLETQIAAALNALTTS